MVNKDKKDEYQKALSVYGDAMKAFRQGKDEKAEELLKSFLEKFRGDRELADRARVYLQIIQNRAAKGKDRPSLKSEEDYYQYGVYRMNMGDIDAAAKALEKARENSPKDARVHYLLALLAIRKGETEECLENLKKSVQLDKFFTILAQNEIDFESLWEDKKFKVITRTS